MRKPGCPQLRVSELRLARLPEKVLQSPGLKVKAWLFHVYKLNAGGLQDGLNVQCCTQSPGFAAVAPPSMEISLSRQKKKKSSFSRQGWWLLRSGNLTTSKTNFQPVLILAFLMLPPLQVPDSTHLWAVGPTYTELDFICHFCQIISSLIHLLSRLQNFVVIACSPLLPFLWGLRLLKITLESFYGELGRELRRLIFHLCTEIFKSLLLFV